MKIHHLNCMTYRLGFPEITHCLLVEAEDRLVFVDTVLGTRDYSNPSRLADNFMKFNQVPRDMEETAIQQVFALGFSPKDVQDILLTYLHIDHAGGLPDFPHAQVHVYDLELEAALNPKGFSFKEKFYLAEHWKHQAHWVTHSLEEETWMGAACATIFQTKPFQAFFLPLHGHSRGHCGIALKTPDKWLLHCGDAYVRQSEVHPDNPVEPFPWFMRFVSNRVFPQGPKRTLRELARQHGKQIRMFCSHDPMEFELLRAE